MVSAEEYLGEIAYHLLSYLLSYLLLRVLDPEFETPVASDYSYVSGITFVAGIAVALGYILFTLSWYMLLAKKKSFARGSQIWALDRQK